MHDEARLLEHLKTLSICHYVYAGFATCGSCAGGIYLAIGLTVPEMMKHAPRNQGQPMPEEMANLFGLIFGGVGALLIVLALTLAVLCFLSGRGLARRRNRTLSLVVAGLVCMTGILGITLGVFTFVILLKPETERLYEAAARG